MKILLIYVNKSEKDFLRTWYSKKFKNCKQNFQLGFFIKFTYYEI